MTTVYDEIRDSLIGPVGAPDSCPVYLSRTRLPSGHRKTLGESVLEHRLAAHGIRVVHPQELPLVDQVHLISHARDVIGSGGSAMHLTIFRSLPGSRTLALNPRTTEVHQLRVDRLRGAEHRHLRVQFPVNPRIPHVFGGRELKLTDYRSFLLPARAERQVLKELAR
jgi:capsular polysaccharide biosynthesis protein